MSQSEKRQFVRSFKSSCGSGEKAETIQAAQCNYPDPHYGHTARYNFESASPSHYSLTPNRLHSWMTGPGLFGCNFTSRGIYRRIKICSSLLERFFRAPIPCCSQGSACNLSDGTPRRACGIEVKNRRQRFILAAVKT